MAISSFLSSFSGNPQGLGNVLQALTAGSQASSQIAPPTQVADVPVTATRPIPQGGMTAAPVQEAAPLGRVPERRQSMIGRVADALAVAGGGQPRYSQGIQQQQALEQERLGTVFKGYQAMLDNGVDPVQARTMLPQLMQQVNMSPEFANQVLSTVEQNPDALQGMIGLAGAAREPETFTGNPIYARPSGDANGPLRVGFRGSRGDIRWVDAPEGYEIADQLQYLDLGNRFQGVGRYGGTATGSAQAQGVNPDVVANNEVKVSEGAADRGSREAIARAQIEARTAAAEAKADGKAPNRQAIADAARPIVTGLKDAVTRLRSSGGMTDTSSSPLDVAGAEIRERLPFVERVTSPEGFRAREDINQLVRSGMTTLVPLVGGMTLGSRNLDAGKELDFWANSILSAKDYGSAMRALEGYERTIEEIEAELGASPPARTGPPARPAPPPARRPQNIRATPRATSAPSAPTVSNW